MAVSDLRLLLAILVVAACVTVTMGAQFWHQTFEVAPGVLRTPLPFTCSLMHYTPASEQPFRTFTLDCPGGGPVRLWPLP